MFFIFIAIGQTAEPSFSVADFVADSITDSVTNSATMTSFSDSIAPQSPKIRPEPVPSGFDTNSAPNSQPKTNQSENRTIALIWGKRAEQGEESAAISPLDGALLPPCRVLSRSDLDAIFDATPDFEPTPTAETLRSTALHLQVFEFAHQLQLELAAMSAELVAMTQRETAFSHLECEEIVAGTLSYLAEFPAYFAEIDAAFASVSAATGGELASQTHLISGARRHLTLRAAPHGTIAVMLPQNALLLLGVICVVNALITGNRVALRAPLQGAGTAALLAQAIERVGTRSGTLSSRVTLVVARGREWLEAAYATASPTLIHYLGASDFGGDILKTAFEHRKATLIDGTGNSWVWVGEADKNGDAASIADMLTLGATRYNGQTCTSINGAMIHPARFDEVCAQLQARWSQLSAGNPTQGAAIGGLFDEKQARFCHERIWQSGGKVVCGGQYSANVLQPTLVIDPKPDSDLVREGVFGPVLWLRSGSREDFVALWPANRFPLCAGIFEAAAAPDWWLARLPLLARLVVNGDPSLEHIFEPWGGYPASGFNPVSFWHQKYQRLVSVDALSGILEAVRKGSVRS